MKVIIHGSGVPVADDLSAQQASDSIAMFRRKEKAQTDLAFLEASKAPQRMIDMARMILDDITKRCALTGAE